MFDSPDTPLHGRRNGSAATRRSWLLCLLGATALATAAWPVGTLAAPVDDAVAELQHEWEVIRYQTPAAEREKRFEALATKAHGVSEKYPGRAEPLVWEGIIVSSWAGEKGGLGALVHQHVNNGT